MPHPPYLPHSPHFHARAQYRQLFGEKDPHTVESAEWVNQFLQHAVEARKKLQEDASAAAVDSSTGKKKKKKKKPSKNKKNKDKGKGVDYE
jgi:hypothetical protein